MKKRVIWISGILVALIIVASAVHIPQESLRRYTESKINTRLKGYSVRIQKLSIHPITFSVDLENVVLLQKAYPDPPVANIDYLHASIHWRELLTGHIVAESLFERPRFYINTKQLMAGVEEASVKEERWQDALAAVYPVKINHFRIDNGELTYIDESSNEPVKVKSLYLTAANIKNIRSAKNVYPSDITFKADFENGKINAKGRADFMLKPHAGVNAIIDIRDIDLGRFKELAAKRGVVINKGTLSADGEMEISPGNKLFDLHSLIISNAEIDIVRSSEKTNEADNKETVAKVEQKARELTDKPGLLIKAEKVRIANSNLGFVSKTSLPHYRIFMNETDLELTNFSNRFSKGPAELHMTGKFMGSGPTTITGTFRPHKEKGPDFNLSVEIKDTSMPAMNPLFRSLGNFDVEKGSFSFYSEVRVQNLMITGYVKPLFRDVKVFDRRTDKEKSEFQKLKEKIIEGVAKLLENWPRKEVATKTSISGKIDNPQTSTWEVIVNLIQNAFIQPILPGLEKNIK